MEAVTASVEAGEEAAEGHAQAEAMVTSGGARPGGSSGGGRRESGRRQLRNKRQTLGLEARVEAADGHGQAEASGPAAWVQRSCGAQNLRALSYKFREEFGLKIK
ncbi:hypothetical protein KSP39_PZI021495 [Platanthera zijinensis]|uniref:Uncharacterized protein n=1 Tax=Platanthera zijinensis TaxID=2320716 RepID=A0AAP0FWF8_9ASPA